MPKIKSHLQELYRTPPLASRQHALRLDLNEGVPGLSDEFVREALAGFDGATLAMYPEYASLIAKISDHNDIGSENILLSNGSAAAIKYIFDAYVREGDRVLLTDPTYAMYPVFCQMHAAKVELVNYKDDFSLPLGEFMEKLALAPRAAVLVNPNNPTGYALGRDDLLAIIRKAAEHDVLLLIDEVYFYFYPHTVIEEVKKWPHLAVLRTFSKLCGMASARLGYVAACPEIIASLRKVRLNFDVNGLAIRFAERLLDRPELIQQMIEQTNEGKRYIINRLREAGTDFHAGEANFVLIHLPGRTVEMAKHLAEKGILVGNGFRQEFLKDYIRVTTGHVPTMEKFWDAFVATMGVIHD